MPSLQFEWTPLNKAKGCLLLGDDPRNSQFPGKITPEGIRVVEVLPGSTLPLKIKIAPTETMESTAVLSELQASGSQAGEEPMPDDGSGKKRKKSLKGLGAATSPASDTTGSQQAGEDVAPDSGLGTKKSNRQPRKRKDLDECMYVLKRGGKRLIDPMHTSHEFLALKLYHLAGAAVPPAALYQVMVRAFNKHFGISLLIKLIIFNSSTVGPGP